MDQRHILSVREDLDGLFLDCAIYWGSLFFGSMRKTGHDRARSHVGGLNLVQRHIFSVREDLAVLF